MILTGGAARSGGRDAAARRIVSVEIALPEHGRPRRSRVSDHLAPYVGCADRTLRGAPGGPLQVDVNIVWPSADRPWTTAYTVGASSRPMAVPSAARPQCSPYAELFLRLPPSWVPERVCVLCTPPRAERDPLADPRTAWPFEWLARLAWLPHVERSFLARGHVVACADEAPRCRDLPFSGFYLDAGWDEAGDRAIPPLSIADGERIDFFGVIPLHATELEVFRERRGSDVLRALDAAQVTELLVPDRPCCVSRPVE